MKPFLPTVLMLVGMFVAGCSTPENVFMAGNQPVAKPVPPVAKVAAAEPVKSSPVVVLPTPKPVNLVPVVVPPTPEPVNPAPVIVPPPEPAPEPVTMATNAVSIAPMVGGPNDATPAPTEPAQVPAAPAVALPTVVTPDTSLAGRVVAYNSDGRFVVLSFPAGQMPKQNQSIFLYRGGLKVGEIKITGPQRDNNTVGDVINGDAKVGDEARDR